MTEATREALAGAIRNLHGGEPVWIEAVPVTEVYEGELVWDGIVQVFDLANHPEADRCYAWSYETEDGKRRFTAVLHKPPVDSPETAVRAAIVAENR